MGHSWPEATTAKDVPKNCSDSADRMALPPTLADVEEASIWLGSDADVFGASEQLSATASQIVTILTSDEDEEAMRAG